MSAWEWLTAFLTGCATGLLSSFGLGGGTLLLLWLTLFAGMDVRTARGINLIYFLPVSAAALPSHFKNGYLPLKKLVWAVLAGTVAAAATAFFMTEHGSHLVDTLFGIYLVAMGVLELSGTGKGRSQK